jgi:hypothetical protein
LVLSLLFHKPIIEGLTSDIVGEYDYLKPVNEIITDAKWQELSKAMNICRTENDKKSSTCINNTVGSVTTDEINYYIKNGYWPWGSYITNIVTNALIVGLGTSDIKTLQKFIDNLRKKSPTRHAYEDTKTDVSEKAMSPQPLSYKIYMGFTSPPAPAPAPATTTTTSTSTTTGTTNKYYNEFVSLCKKVNPV